MGRQAATAKKPGIAHEKLFVYVKSLQRAAQIKSSSSKRGSTTARALIAEEFNSLAILLILSFPGLPVAGHCLGGPINLNSTWREGVPWLNFAFVHVLKHVHVFITFQMSDSEGAAPKEKKGTKRKATTEKKTRAKRAKKDPNAPKRAQTAYMFFTQ